MPNISCKRLSIQSSGYKSDFAALAERRRYRVDLSGHIACCEGNYARLLKLLPELSERERWRFSVGHGENHGWHAEICVVERAKYTTTLEISQNDALHQWGQDAQLRLQVRLYHDAGMAEVLDWRRQLSAHYDYPNEKLYWADEKAQRNQFLSEWLDSSMRHGMAQQDLNLSGLTD